MQFSLNDTRRQLKEQIELYQAIMDYWGAIGATLRGRWTLQDQLPGKRLLGTNPYREIGIATQYDAELDQLNAKLDQQIEARQFLPAMRVTWPRIRELNALALGEQSRQLLAKLDGGELKDLRSEKPGSDHPCVPAKYGSAVAAPLPAPDFAPAAAAPAKASGSTTGSTTVIAVVTPEGCAEQALLAHKADATPIDVAGLKDAANGRYLPAQKDGMPVRSALLFRLKNGAPE